MGVRACLSFDEDFGSGQGTKTEPYNKRIYHTSCKNSHYFIQFAGFKILQRLKTSKLKSEDVDTGQIFYLLT